MVNKNQIIKKYNFVDNKLPNLGFNRKLYLDKIRPSFGVNDLIKVIIGQRRVGKSYLLRQIINILINEQKVNPKNILYLNFEYEDLFFIKNNNDLKGAINNYFSGIKGKIYLFLDEIQEIEGWEKLINSYRADHTIETEVFISGSNSKLLSSELATYLSGRYIEFKIFPFNYDEFLEIKKLEKTKDSFLKYINFSGLPELYNLPNDELRFNFIKSLKDTIILKDLVKRYNVKDVDLVEKVFLFLVNNIGNSLSLNSIRKKLLQEGTKINVATLGNYTRYFEEIFIVHSISRFDLHGKRVLEGEKKYYLNDLGFLNFLYSSFESFISKKVENYVHNYLISKGYKVFIGKIGTLEIDFVAEKKDRKIYIQTAYLLHSQDTIKREYGNLRKINDSFEKYVVTLDDMQFPIDDYGIKHVQARNLNL